MKVSLFWFSFCIVHSSSVVDLELVDVKYGFVAGGAVAYGGYSLAQSELGLE
jgi:hypothetical protein